MKRLLIILTLAGLPCAPFAQTRLTLDACIAVSYTHLTLPTNSLV